MRTRTKALGLLVVALSALSGCAVMTGYSGAKSTFSCKAPDGVRCESMTGVYANAMQNNLPGQQVTHKTTGDKKGAKTAVQNYAPAVMTKTLSSGAPIRSNPRQLRLWMAPWVDSDGDLHDQSFIYVTTDYGDWQIEHVKRSIEQSYQPVRGPTSGSLSSSIPSTAQPTQDAGSVTRPSASAQQQAIDILRENSSALRSVTGGSDGESTSPAIPAM
jgi:conjugal transfer pilus assembly protein TraV